jgi:CHAT domain-containing protein
MSVIEQFLSQGFLLAIADDTRVGLEHAAAEPDYENDWALDSAGEVEFVESRLKGSKIENASVGHLNTFFADNHASLLHFVCHGAADIEDDDAIYLDDDEVLRSESLRPLKGFKALCRKRAPFVFLNACDTGRLTPSLTGGAGFPMAFGDRGARAVLAPLWPVEDTLAHDIAIEVYETAPQADAPPIAGILRRIRAYEDTDADTYAAYAFYGDPLAKLELVTE